MANRMAMLGKSHMNSSFKFASNLSGDNVKVLWYNETNTWILGLDWNANCVIKHWNYEATGIQHPNNKTGKWQQNAVRMLFLSKDRELSKLMRRWKELNTEKKNHGRKPGCKGMENRWEIVFRQDNNHTPELWNICVLKWAVNAQDSFSFLFQIMHYFGLAYHIKIPVKCTEAWE